MCFFILDQYRFVGSSKRKEQEQRNNVNFDSLLRCSSCSASSC